MKKEEKKFWQSKKMMFGVGFFALLLLVVVLWRPVREKYTLFKDWRHERRIQVIMGQEPYSWGEYMDYLKRQKEEEAKTLQWLKDKEQSYWEDARNSLGGDTPEEAYDMLRQALRDNDLERALSLSFVDYREGVREALQPYADKDALSSLIEKWDLDDMDCSKSTEQVCEFSDEYHYCPYHGELICHAPDSPIDGVMVAHDIEFIKNVLDKWQLRGY